MTFPLAELVMAAYARDRGDGSRSAPHGVRATETVPTPLPDDAELVSRVREGDRTLFERMYVAHYAGLRRLAAHLTSASDVADDAIQDVFTALWMRRASWTVGTTVRAYLAGAGRRAIQHVGRHAGVVRRTETSWPDADHAPALGAAPQSPDDHAEERDLVERMARAIRALPPRRQAAILLRWHDGMTTAEIAETLGISDRVARKFLAAAETALRAEFDRLR